MNSTDKWKQLLSPLYSDLLSLFDTDSLCQISICDTFMILFKIYLFVLYYFIYFGASANGKMKKTKQPYYLRKNTAGFLQYSFGNPRFGGLC